MNPTNVNKSIRVKAARHLDDKYFNSSNTPYATTDEVLAQIDVLERVIDLTVDVAGVEYWFHPDIYTLVGKADSLAISDISITNAKLVNVPTMTVKYRRTAGDGPPEDNTLAQLKTDLNITKSDVGLGNVDNTSDVNKPVSAATQTALNLKVDAVDGWGVTQNNFTNDDAAKLDSIIPPQQILLSASTDVATRISGGATKPDGWTLAASDGTNLLITHTLTGHKIAFVNVFEIDGTKETWLSFDKGTAGSGFSSDGMTVLISGLAPAGLAVRIELIFD